MGQIKIWQGKWNETCVSSSNLTENQAKKPAIREIMEYTDQRALSTLIVAGAKTPYDLRVGTTDGVPKTKIGKIPQGQEVGDRGYRYKIMGRIQIPSVINSQVGSTAADGTFVLSMKDNYLTPGMNTKFYSDWFYARVISYTGSAGNYLYTFRGVNETLFDYAVHVAPMQGEKLAFGAYTSFSEGSLRGYGRTHYPSTFINFMTIQRKAIAITGSALTDVTWVEFNGKQGWFWTEQAQQNLQFMMENEHQKFDGLTTMKDSAGNLRTVSYDIDQETGFEIVAGDGLIPQILGGNDFYASGAEGNFTLDDLKDMMTMLEKKSAQVYGNIWYVITGTDGYVNAQEILKDAAYNDYGVRQQAGVAADIEVGGNFDRFKFAGNMLIFVKHPLWDDENRWFERGSDGKLLRSKMLLFIDARMRAGNTSNMEILTKGAYGINRSMVTAYLNGMTGMDGKTAFSSVDAISYEMLKEDMIVCYDTTGCGIIRAPQY